MTVQDDSGDSEYGYSLTSASEGPARTTPKDGCYIPSPLSVPRLLALVSSNFGLQVFWSTVMANLSPFLHSLGLSKAATAVIIVSQPLSGAIVGPCVGAFSDRLRTKWGRRRPLIVGGASLTALVLLLLAWSDESVRFWSCWRGHCGNHETVVSRIVVTVAIFWTLLLSMAVQPLQSGIRSLMVDQAPPEEQSRVSAWASCAAGVGGILGFSLGSVSLPDALPGIHFMTQFQVLALSNCFVLGLTAGLTCFWVHEKSSEEMVLNSSAEGYLAPLSDVLKTLANLPDRIQHLCKIQFCAWFAWFSFLYYDTTFISELVPPHAESHMLQTRNHGVRTGAFASLCFAIVALLTNIILPTAYRKLLRLRPISALSTQGGKAGLEGLPLLWTISQAFLGVLLVSVLLINSHFGGTLVIGLCGLSWAVTQWVPYAIIGHDVAAPHYNDADANDEIDASPTSSGAILGVHNMAISLPQILAGLADGAIYKLAEAANSKVPTSWVFALGSTAAFAAAVQARRLA